MGVYMRWFPTSQRMPDKSDQYLVTIDRADSRTVELCDFKACKNGGTWSRTGDGIVMAWAYVPDPCKRAVRVEGDEAVERPHRGPFTDRQLSQFKKIERALEISLTHNQKLFIAGKISRMPEERGSGRTMAYLLKYILEDSKKPQHLYIFGEDYGTVPDHDPIKGLMENDRRLRMELLKGLYRRLRLVPRLVTRVLYFDKEEVGEV